MSVPPHMTADLETRIRDAAHVLLDLCTQASEAPPKDHPDAGRGMKAESVSTAVQALIMADFMKPGADLKDRLTPPSDEDIKALFLGLGLGVGSSLGAGSGALRLIAWDAYELGLDTGMSARAREIAELNRRGLHG